MNPKLFPLVQLQGLDLRSAEIKEQRLKIPDLLQVAERPLLQATQRLREATALAEKSAKSRRDRELDLESQEAQIQKLKARVTEIKKNTEYQAHLFEIQISNKKKGEIEEQILVLMEQGEQHHTADQEAKAGVAKAEAGFAERKAELHALDVKLAAELEALQLKQQETIRVIDKSLLTRYNKLKATRKDMALALVKDGICYGCRLQLPPQLVAEVKRSDDLQMCTFCHRILYWEDPTGIPASLAPESVEKVEHDLPEPA